MSDPAPEPRPAEYYQQARRRFLAVTTPTTPVMSSAEAVAVLDNLRNQTGVLGTPITAEISDALRALVAAYIASDGFETR